jgi:branched-chain amino acid transport system ATP-binding protein
VSVTRCIVGRDSHPSPSPSPSPPPIFELDGIVAGYGRGTVLRDVDIRVHSGEVVALLGGNGAGKTTTMRVGAGLLRPARGSVRIHREDFTKRSPHERSKAGLCLIPEGRGIFRSLTVGENLRLAVPPWIHRSESARAIDAFPFLGERLSDIAGTLSGGQQQMLALARAFVSDPKVVLVDEVSLGLAPLVVEEAFAALRILTDRGTAVLLVEQYVDRALGLADTVIVLRKGRVAYSAPRSDVDESTLHQYYLDDRIEEST